MALALVTPTPATMSEEELACVAQLNDFLPNYSLWKEKVGEGNRVSLEHGHVLHGADHAEEVAATFQFLADQYDLHPVARNMAMRPVLTPYQRLLGTISGRVHDVGRSQPVETRDQLRYDHHRVGAVIANDILKSAARELWGDEKMLPEQSRRDVVWAVANHGAHSWIDTDTSGKKRSKRLIKDIWMALFLLADKTAGSEARVEDRILKTMRRLAALPVGDLRSKYGLDDQWTLARPLWGVQRIPPCMQTLHDELLYADVRNQLLGLGEEIPTFRIDGHHHVNGAITDRQLHVVPDNNPEGNFWGTLVYQLTVDERIADLKAVTQLDWWDLAFYLIAMAAECVGWRVLLEFNGRPLVYNEAANDWEPAPTNPRRKL